jgi:glycine/D-amino acid oxidase-like deaminating enzyme/nitrite reductase/ring-hydroxylating ferredoxin subunit
VTQGASPSSSSGKGVSLWVDTAPATSYPPLRGEVTVDFAVVGGGIAGLTAALLLKQGGARVAVVEAGRIGTGVTGHTTGKLSSLHRLVYRELRRSVGEKGARAYGEANEAAIDRVATLVEDEGIACDFRRVANHTYAESDEGRKRVEDEARLAAELGLPASYVDSVDLPFGVSGAVRFADQAQLHAARYLIGLAQAVAGDGSHVFEQTAPEVSGGNPRPLQSVEGTVTADAVIVATNIPFLDRGLFFARCHAYRSYLIAVGLDGRLPEDTFISAEEPLRSVMPYRSNGRELLLVGGEGHRAGDRVDAAERYRTLETWARERFPVTSLEYRWSTQDAMPVDGVPYVGPLTPLEHNLYVATGFRKWGLSNGTVAGMILADRLLGRENPWASLFNSNRLRPLAGGRRFVTENLRAGAQLARSRLSRPSGSLRGLGRGDGRVVELGGDKVAAHRDERGELHLVSAVCTHLGCLVDWNGTEQTWDCPCHGSRFARTGKVLQGPAVKDLPPAAVID